MVKRNVYTVRKKRLFSPFFKWLLIVLAAAVLLAVGLFFFFKLSFWQVKTVSVDYKGEDQEGVVKAALLDLGNNHKIKRLFGTQHILYYPKRSQINLLKVNDEILKSVVVTRKLFKREIVFSVESFEVFGRYCAQGGACYLVSDSGIVFRPVFDGSLYEFLTFYDENAQGVSLGVVAAGGPEYFLGMRETIQALSEVGLMPEVVRVRDFSVREWLAQTDTGKSLLFSFDFPVRDFSSILKKISPNVLMSTQYMDFRVPNKIYYQ